MEALGLFIALVGAFWIVLYVGPGTGPDAEPRHRPLADPAPTGQAQLRGKLQPPPAKPGPTARPLEGRAYIIDGDSLVIQRTQIRLFGVDAPEINHPYGNTAKWALIGLCRGHDVRAQVDHIDHYGRTVARCYLPDGRDLSAEMVKLGMAIDWPKFSGGRYRAFEQPDVRKKLWLAEARQRGRMHVWAEWDARQKAREPLRTG